MSITLETSPLTKQLTTEANLNAELGETVDSSLATRLIDEASERVFLELDRPLWRAQYVEKVMGTSRRRLMLSRYPIASLDQVVYDGDTQTLADFSIEHAEAGFIDYDSKFGRTALSYAESNPLAWEITYTAGYFMPNDDLSSFDVSVNGTDESFNSATSLFPGLLRAGDIINLTTGVAAANQGYHILSAATTAKLTTTSDLTTEGEVSSTILIRNVPPLYERVCLDLAKDAFQGISRSSSVDRVRVGEVEITFSHEAVQKALASLPGRQHA